MKPPLDISTLAEAAAWLIDATGSPWTEAELLNAAMAYRVTLHAGPPVDANVRLCRFTDDDGLIVRSAEGFVVTNPSVGWRMAELYPIHIAQVLAVGETETIHAAGQTLREGEVLWFAEPVRVAREMVRVSGAALTEILSRRARDKRHVRYTERAQAKVVPKPTGAINAPPVAGRAESDDWRSAARAIADEFDALDAKGGAYDSVSNMADRVAQCMRQRGIKGKRGPVSGQTVLREALQGSRWKRKRRVG